jgi:hypothetical protein
LHHKKNNLVSIVPKEIEKQQPEDDVEEVNYKLTGYPN